MTSSQHERLVTASHCMLTGSSHGISLVAFVVMTGSHHGNDNDDWQSAHMLLQRGPSCDDLEVIMGTIVMTGCHHGSNSDDWQSVQVLLQCGQSCDDWKSSWEQ